MQSQSPLPERLKQARKAKKIAQRELGIRVGLEPNTASARMNQYERGKHTPDYSTLEKLAKELGVPVPYFFCDSEELADVVKLLAELDRNDLLEFKTILENKVKAKPTTPGSVDTKDTNR